MPIKILMPALSPTMTEGKLAKWTKSEGDNVQPGDVIAEIETDKATMEIEAVEEGTIAKILVNGGTENVAVNTPIAVLVEEDEKDADVDAFLANDNSSAAAQPAQAPTEAPAPVAQSNGVVAQVEGEVIENRDILYAQGAVLPPVPFDEQAFFDAGTEELTMREALRAGMSEEMRKDDDIYLMGEEVAEYNGAFKVSQGMLEEFGPDRVIDSPITEHGFTGLAVGSAMSGLKPIVEYMTWNFALQAIDHILNSAGKTLYMSGGQLGCPIVFRGSNGAAYGDAAQHSQDFASWYGHIPGLKVVAVANAADAKGLMKAAIQDPNPVCVLEHEKLYGESCDVPTSEDYVIPIGRAKIERAGTDVTLVSYGLQVSLCLEAAEQLAEQGIDAEVINLRTIRPIDRYTIIESVKKTNRIVSVEEGWAFAGIGSEIAAMVNEHAFDYLDAPVERVCAADVPMPYAQVLEELALPKVEEVIAAAKKACYK